MRGFPRHDWVLAARDERAVQALARSTGMPRPIAGVLHARGFRDARSVRQFLSPSLQALSDPFLLDDMDIAVDRIWRAIDRREAITVFSDFDADGVCSAALLVGVLQRLGARVTAFLPHRFEEGYGLTPAAMHRCFAEQRPALIITSDCGINAMDEVRMAGTVGVDVIVTDHHELSDDLPPALAVINPKRGASPASRVLAGVGVAFKLCHAIVKAGRNEARPPCETVDLRAWLDLVALGTVADVAPLTGENRTLVSAGLRRMRRCPSRGIAALMRRAGIDGDPGSYHLGFILGPRVNAAGRMHSARDALALLMSEDDVSAHQLADLLEQRNRERRHVEADILKELDSSLTGFDAIHSGAFVAAGSGWHAGAIGIVAARLAERFNRPAAVVTLDATGGGRGSVRSAAGVDVLRAIRACAPLLDRSGGHCRAAGFVLRSGAIEAFRDRFTAACREQIPDLQARPPLTLDGWLSHDEVNAELCAAMATLEPFGEGNPLPRWGMGGLHLAQPPQRMGREGEHARLALQAGNDRVFEAVAFNLGGSLMPASQGSLAAAFELSINRFRGNERLQLRLLDLMPDANVTQVRVQS